MTDLEVATQQEAQSWTPGAPHTPVLLAEVLEVFRGGGQRRVVVDCTVGFAGHAVAMLAEPGPQIELLIGMDRDPDALRLAGARLRTAEGKQTSAVPARLCLRQGNFASLGAVLDEQGVAAVDFALLDLGVSTYQLKTASRGFSLMLEGPLDMRMDPGSGHTARELLETAGEAELAGWLREFGEARFAGRIARVLCERRGAIRTTADLTQAVLSAVPAAHRRNPGGIHPATQVFQALRIAVNSELENLDAVLPVLLERLAPGGRLAAISFHSLEDRRVKQAFERAARECVCPPRMPVCGCRHRASVRLLHRGAIQPGAAELAANPASRSARLRAVEKLEAE